MIAAIILALALYALICHRSLRLGVLVFVASLPLYLIRFDLGLLPTTFLEIQFGILFVFWALQLRDKSIRKSLLAIPRSRFTKWISAGTIFILIGGLLGMTQTSDLASSLGVWKSYLVEPILLALIILTVELKENKKNVTKQIVPYLIALSVPTILIGLVSIFQTTTGISIPENYLLAGRATAFYSYPNAVGLFVAPVVIILIAAISTSKVRKNLSTNTLRLFIVTSALGLVAIVAAKTEAAIVALVVAAIFISVPRWFKLSKQKMIIRIVLAVIALPLFLIALSSAGINAVDKLTLQDWSGQTRVAGWEETYHLLQSNPHTLLFGTGMNDFPVAVAPFHTHDYLEIFQYPHNLILNAWTELGFIGLYGLLIIAIAIFRATIKNPKPIKTVLFGALLVMTVHGLVDVPYFKNDLAFMTWAIIALFYFSSISIDKRA